MQGNMTLERLSNAILNACEFDFDHLYRFTYTDRRGVATHINHPYMEDGHLWADEFHIGDLPLNVGQSMTYLYDFGDNWMFKIQLEKIDPKNSKMKNPVILESQGKAPEQYWSDDYDE